MSQTNVVYEAVDLDYNGDEIRTDADAKANIEGWISRGAQASDPEIAAGLKALVAKLGLPYVVAEYKLAWEEAHKTEYDL